MVFVIILFAALLLVFIWMYIGYPFALWIISKLKDRTTTPDQAFRPVSVIVCTYNEKTTIQRRINNLLESDFPKENLEIIIVDSNSTDGTAELVDQIITPLIDDYDIKLIREEARRGKVSAINIGLQIAKNDIIVLTDSPTVFWPDTLKYVVQNYADPQVGAVTGNFVRQQVDGNTTAQNTEWIVFNYRKILRMLESAVDSTTWLSGELTSFRKSIIPKLPTSVIVDDAHIAMSIRQKGFRVVVDQRAKYAEKRPTIYSETVTNKIKAIAPGIREMVRFRKILLNPHYGIYGLLILPARVMHFYLNPFILIGLVISGIILVINYLEIKAVLVGIVLIVVLLLLASQYKKGQLIRLLIAFILMQYIIIAGLFQYIRGNYSATWKQTSSTR